MINTSKCKDIAKSLVNQSREKLGEQKLNEFFAKFNKIVAEYEQKYIFYSTAIELQKLESFNKWLPRIIKDKDLLTPIVVDKMVNEKDLYSLSVYQNFYAGTNLIPNINDYKSEGCEDENVLAVVTGCHWIEHSDILAE